MKTLLIIVSILVRVFVDCLVPDETSQNKIKNFPEKNNLAQSQASLEARNIGVGSKAISLSYIFEDGSSCPTCENCSENEGEDKLIDSVFGTKLCINCGATNECVFTDTLIVVATIDFEKHFVAGEYVVTSAKDYPDRDPKEIWLEGSNDGGISWVELDRQAPIWNSREMSLPFKIKNPTGYLSYRLKMRKQEFSNENKLQLSELTFKVGCSNNNDCSDFIDSINYGPCYVPTCDALSNLCMYAPVFSKSCRSVGMPKTLAIRVVANDTETTSSLHNISNYVFGTFGDTFTMTSRFSECSHDIFNIQAFSGTTLSGEIVSNGVAEVRIAKEIIGLSTGTVSDLVISAANDKFGFLEDQFDFVMLCLPRGTRIGTSFDWKAYAYVNSYLSIYNDEYCNFPSVQMHEIGHNMGLSHSNDDVNYGDESCIMGISYNRTDGPYRCFNGPKSWYLGWYKGSYAIVDARAPKSTIIVGIIDYSDRGDKSTVIKLINSEDGFDYYITYNRVYDTTGEEGENQIYIVKQEIGFSYASSTVVARQNTAMKYYIYQTSKAYSDRKNALQVRGYIGNGPPMYASIIFELNIGFSCVAAEHCNDFNSCTVDTCALVGTERRCKHTVLSCLDCGSKTTLNIITNDFPEYLTWEILDVKSNIIVQTSGYYTKPNMLHEEAFCLPYSRYLLSISYASNNTDTNVTSFDLKIEDRSIDNGTISEETYIETAFIICSTNEDCQDYDGCNLDFCNDETHLCEYSTEDQKDSCNDCSWLSVEIKLDNYPEETTWEIYDYETRDTVLSGDPYPVDTEKAGRRSKPTKSGRRKAPTRLSSKALKSNDNKYYILDDEEIRSVKCLEAGFLYHFIIRDSFGDGICCDESEGGYEIKVNDSIIKSGGNYSYYEEIFFKFLKCSSNQNCEDGNNCTNDVCDTELSICFYYLKPCSECGSVVKVTIFTDVSPDQTYWKIFEGNHEVMAGGPFLTQHKEYESTSCLPFGFYTFTIFDTAENGFHFSSLPCGFTLSIDQTIIKEKRGIYDESWIYQRYPFIVDSISWIEYGQMISGSPHITVSTTAVALSKDGKFLVVGDGGHAGFRGNVCTYQINLNETQWLQVGKCIEGEERSDWIGKSVSISRDGKIIAFNAPKPKIFKLDEQDNWVQMGIVIDGEGYEYSYGQSVSLSDDAQTIAIAVSKSTSNVIGIVRVLRYNNTENIWKQMGQDLLAEEEMDRFGSSISLSGDGVTVAIGAPGGKKLYVYKFDKMKKTWFQLGQTLLGEYREFGISTSLSRNGLTVAVGSPHYNVDRGNVAVFRFDTIQSIWKQRGLDIEGEEERDDSGRSISLSDNGEIISIGAPGNGANKQGHVRVYSFREYDKMWIKRGLDVDGESEREKSGSFVSLSGDGQVLAISSKGVADPGYDLQVAKVRIFKMYDSQVSEPLMNDLNSSQPSSSPHYDSVSPSTDPIKGKSYFPSSSPSFFNLPSYNPSMDKTLRSQAPSSIKSTYTESLAPSFRSHQSFYPSISDIQLSQEPSIIDTIIPTLSDSPQLYNWTLGFKGSYKSDNKPNSNRFDLHYSISKGKTLGQMKSTVMEDSCIEKVNEDTIAILNHQIIVRNNEVLDELVVPIKLNKTMVENSSLWNLTSETSGIISFCVKTEILLDEESNLSVSFEKTKIFIAIDFKASFGNFLIENITLADEYSIVQQTSSYHVIACICTNENICEKEPIVYANSVLNICVKPLSDIQVKEFENVFFYQDGISKFKPIENGIASPLTSISTGNIGIIRTSVISSFFEESTPSQLTISGTAILGFESNNRHLAEKTRQKQSKNYDKSSPFQIKVDLFQENDKGITKALKIGLSVGFTISSMVVVVYLMLNVRSNSS